jgi:hypothetical protein
MTADQCDPLSIANVVCRLSGMQIVVSCWKLTSDELDEFNRTGRVWLLVYGKTMPPVALSANNPFFKGQ